MSMITSASNSVCSGKEVAKFVKMKYPEILVNLESFRAGDVETALRESFHKMDELIEDEVRICVG